ncbi:hypothetical protein B0H16DRAFT_1888732 [Mycena metata]|uniref:Uncharacterized protein n=1 Tax=Mycena metata TaxID=1033252 RepID=A0AAD7IRV1_9AGAR|nr:hypothetical protein B0H16DRAFT_1888732 [Mycena metata]
MFPTKTTVAKSSRAMGSYGCVGCLQNHPTRGHAAFVCVAPWPLSIPVSFTALYGTLPLLLRLRLWHGAALHIPHLPETRTSLPRSRPPPHRAPLPFGPRDCANSARIVTLQTCASCIDARWRRERVHHKQYKSEKVRTIISIHLSLPTHQARFPLSTLTRVTGIRAHRSPHAVRAHHRAISDLIDDRSPLPSFL